MATWWRATTSDRRGLAGIEIASSGNAVVQENIVVGNTIAAILVNGYGRRNTQVINDQIRDNDTDGRGVQGCFRPGVTCEENT